MVDIPKFDDTPSGQIMRNVCVAINSGDESQVDHAFDVAMRHFGQLNKKARDKKRAEQLTEIHAASGDPDALRRLANKNLASKRR